MHFHWLKHGWKQQAPIFHLSDLESDAQPLAVGPVAKWIRRWFGKPSMASRSLAKVKFRHVEHVYVVAFVLNIQSAADLMVIDRPLTTQNTMRSVRRSPQTVKNTSAQSCTRKTKSGARWRVDDCCLTPAFHKLYHCNAAEHT